MTTSKGVLGVFLGASCVFMAGAGTPAAGQCQLAKLTAGDATSCGRCGDVFGISVSIDGDFIAVGAPDGLPGSPPSNIPGATYIFRRDGIAAPPGVSPVGNVGRAPQPLRVSASRIGRDRWKKDGFMFTRPAAGSPDDLAERSPGSGTWCPRPRSKPVPSETTPLTSEPIVANNA